MSEAVTDDLRLVTESSVLAYPALEVRPDRALQDDNYGERLRALKRLVRDPHESLVVTSIQALLQPAPARQRLSDETRALRVGQTLEGDNVARGLTERGYHATCAVELPGEFSLRCGILDLYASDW